MKTKRRHELQTNVLADWLGHRLEAVKPYFKTVTGMVIAVAALAITAAYFLHTRTAKIGYGWNDFYAAFSARDADRLRTVAESHPGTTAALWARQSEGDIKLGEGIETLFVDRGEAKEALERAKESYLEVEQSGRGVPMLLQRSRYGLAQTYEALSELDKARDYYEKVARDFPDSALGRESKKRLEALSDVSTERWYNWFARQKPRPRGTSPATSTLPPGAGGAGDADLPFDLGSLSDRPDLSFPGSKESPPRAGDKEPGPDVKPPLTESEGTKPETAPSAPATPATKPQEEPESKSESGGVSEHDSPATPDKSPSSPGQDNSP